MREYIDIGDGVLLTPLTLEESQAVYSNLRDGDLQETVVFGDTDPANMLGPDSWCIRYRGVIIGAIAILRFPDDEESSGRRFVAMLSTNEVWKIKRAYVRYSRDVLRAVVERLPKHVGVLFALPMESYVGAVSWLERVLGFGIVNKVSLNGVVHVLMMTSRQEV